MFIVAAFQASVWDFLFYFLGSNACLDILPSKIYLTREDGSLLWNTPQWTMMTKVNSHCMWQTSIGHPFGPRVWDRGGT